MGVKRGDCIALLGGTGFVGRALVFFLHAQGYRVRVATRHPERHRDLLVLPHLELVPGDVHNPFFLEKVVDGAQAVVNLVGILDARRPGEFTQVHAVLPSSLGRIAAGAGVRVVHISAVQADPTAHSAYLQSKGWGEHGLREGLAAAIVLRPSVIYGPGDHLVCRFLRWFRWAPLGLPLPGASSLMSPVFVEDIVAAIGYVLVSPYVLGQTYTLCGPEDVTLGEIVAVIAQRRGYRRRIYALPPWLARIVAQCGQVFPGRPFGPDQLAVWERSKPCPRDGAGFADLHITPRSLTTALSLLATSGQWYC